jgi:hypothetical protein
VTSASFSSEGKLIITSNYDHTVKISDARTGLPVTHPARFQRLVQP